MLHSTELSFIQFILLSIWLHTIHLHTIIFIRIYISYDLVLLCIILYYYIIYRLYCIRWNLILLFSPQPCCVKYSCIRLYCIVYHHAQLIVCNGIVLHSIVIIIGCIELYFIQFDCKR